MKKILFFLLLIPCLLSAQNSRTYMDIHMADGSVVQYENSLIEYISFRRLDMDNSLVLDSINKLEQGDYNDECLWMNGSINYTKGGVFSSSVRLVTTDYLDEAVDYLVLNDAIHGYLFAFENDNYVGAWNYSDGFLNTKVSDVRKFMNLGDIKKMFPTYRFKLVLYKADGSNISPSESFLLQMYNRYYFFEVLVPTNQQRKAVITFIDDDGFSEAGDVWEKIHDDCGVNPTMALITNRIGLPGRMDWTTINRLQQSGFEFVSHTHNHKVVTTLTAEEMESDFSASHLTMLEHGANADFIVYPQNRRNELSDIISSKYFKGAFIEGDYMNIPPIDKSAIKRYSIFSNQKEIIYGEDGKEYSVFKIKSEEKLKEIVDEAILRGGWVVFMCHFRNSFTDGYHYSPEMGETISRLVKYARYRGVRLMNIENAFLEFSK